MFGLSVLPGDFQLGGFLFCILSFPGIKPSRLLLGWRRDSSLVAYNTLESVLSFVDSSPSQKKKKKKKKKKKNLPNFCLELLSSFKHPYFTHKYMLSFSSFFPFSLYHVLFSNISFTYLLCLLFITSPLECKLCEVRDFSFILPCIFNPRSYLAYNSYW
jgi:hypothetical protein